MRHTRHISTRLSMLLCLCVCWSVSQIPLAILPFARPSCASSPLRSLAPPLPLCWLVCFPFFFPFFFLLFSISSSRLDSTRLGSAEGDLT